MDWDFLAQDLFEDLCRVTEGEWLRAPDHEPLVDRLRVVDGSHRESRHIAPRDEGMLALAAPDHRYRLAGHHGYTDDHGNPGFHKGVRRNDRIGDTARLQSL